MNAKKTKTPPAVDETEIEREIDEALPTETPTPVDPQPEEEEIIDLAEPAAETEEERNAKNHTDTTGLEEAAAATDEVIDLSNTDLVGHAVIGGGIEVAPEPTSPVGITQPLVPAVEDVSDFSMTSLPREELNKLDETDPARSAALRSQANWLADSSQMKAFQGPDRDEQARIDHIAQMDQIDRRNREQQKKDDAAKERAEQLANRVALLAGLRSQYDELKQRAMNIVEQIKALEALEDEPEETV